MNGKYYPNNWEAIKDAPAEFFDSITWEEFSSWRIGGWEIPSSVMCIMRAENLRTGKITEHTYSQPKSAHNRLIKYMETGDYSITIANAEAIHLIKTNNDQIFDPTTD
jgi:hypothetical protein